MKMTPNTPFRYTCITRHNISTLHLAIKLLLSRASHIAVDCEFTGLGDPKRTRSQNIEERYTSLRQVVLEHALVSLGMSVFERIETQSDEKKAHYLVHNLSFLLLSRSPYKVDPSSLTFLTQNGFDLNDQVENGIPYSPGKEDSCLPATDCSVLMRSIFMALVTAVTRHTNSPLVLHNGLMDLMFLYQSFYAELPQDLPTFLADISDLFTSKGNVTAIVDTKVISDYVTREKVSFLSYLFRKYQRKHEHASSPLLTYELNEPIPHKINKKLTVAEAKVTNQPQPKKMFPDTGKPYCEQYAFHGFCRNGRDCIKSHDLDLILDHEEGMTLGSMKSKKRKLETNAAVEITTTSSSQTNPDISDSLLKTFHSGVYDSFMTGYIYAHQLMQDSVQNHMGQLYLIGKPMPLFLVKSEFAAYSNDHVSMRLKRKAR